MEFTTIILFQVINCIKKIAFCFLFLAMSSISSSIVSSSSRTIFCPDGNPRKRRKIARVEVDKTKHKDIKWDQLPAQKVNTKQNIFNPGFC